LTGVEGDVLVGTLRAAAAAILPSLPVVFAYREDGPGDARRDRRGPALTG
jgi:hypothetical protein